MHRNVIPDQLSRGRLDEATRIMRSGGCRVPSAWSLGGVGCVAQGASELCKGRGRCEQGWAEVGRDSLLGRVK